MGRRLVSAAEELEMPIAAPLARPHDRLESGLERMLAELRRMSEAQRRFRPHEGAWSPVQVSHHLLLAQRGTVGAIEKLRGKKPRRRSLAQGLAHQAVKLVLRCGIRVKNPAPSATPDPTVTFAELEPEWAGERARLHELLESMDERAAGDAGFKHPVAGPLTVEESLAFLAAHVEHHLRQLDRIRADANFPE